MTDDLHHYAIWLLNHRREHFSDDEYSAINSLLSADSCNDPRMCSATEWITADAALDREIDAETARRSAYLSQAGETIFGSPTAAAMGLTVALGLKSDRDLRRWLAGSSQPPLGILRDAAKLLRQHVDEAQALAGEIEAFATPAAKRP
jgi:hypothetical protein